MKEIQEIIYALGNNKYLGLNEITTDNIKYVQDSVPKYFKNYYFKYVNLR